MKPLQIENRKDAFELLDLIENSREFRSEATDNIKFKLLENAKEDILEEIKQGKDEANLHTFFADYDLSDLWNLSEDMTEYNFHCYGDFGGNWYMKKAYSLLNNAIKFERTLTFEGRQKIFQNNLEEFIEDFKKLEKSDFDDKKFTEAVHIETCFLYREIVNLCDDTRLEELSEKDKEPYYHSFNNLGTLLAYCENNEDKTKICKLAKAVIEESKKLPEVNVQKQEQEEIKILRENLNFFYTEDMESIAIKDPDLATEKVNSCLDAIGVVGKNDKELKDGMLVLNLVNFGIELNKAKDYPEVKKNYHESVQNICDHIEELDNYIKINKLDRYDSIEKVDKFLKIKELDPCHTLKGDYIKSINSTKDMISLFEDNERCKEYLPELNEVLKDLNDAYKLSKKQTEPASNHVIVKDIIEKIEKLENEMEKDSTLEKVMDNNRGRENGR